MNRNLPEHILQTASELFYQNGIQATGVDTIVKASGVAKMSLYKYFPSKDDLILAYLQSRGDAIKLSIQTHLAEHPVSDQQKLLLVFDVLLEMVSSPTFRGCPFINASAEFADHAEPIQQAVVDFYDGFCAFLTQLAEQAGIKQPNQLAKQLMILMTGALVREQIQVNSGAMQQAKLMAEVLIQLGADGG